LRYWDSSALVAFLLDQGASTAVRELFARDPDIGTWALSDTEVYSALCRLEREGSLSPDGFQTASDHFERLWRGVYVITAVDAVKHRARRLLRTHALRSADALQLGAALVATADAPWRAHLVTLDTRLAEAARREGFSVTP
jgi:predicted nucleic acid-binding protein